MGNSKARTRQRKDFVRRYQPAISRIRSLGFTDTKRAKLIAHLTEVARNELGYSPHTQDADIWITLNATFARLKNKQGGTGDA